MFLIIIKRLKPYFHSVAFSFSIIPTMSTEYFSTHKPTRKATVNTPNYSAGIVHFEEFAVCGFFMNIKQTLVINRVYLSV